MNLGRDHEHGVVRFVTVTVTDLARVDDVHRHRTGLGPGRTAGLGERADRVRAGGTEAVG